jgi:predicted nucleic acid-binding protein
LKAVVVDAGPLIHYAEISCLEFLNIFDVLHIPDAVWHETVAQGRLSHSGLTNIQSIQRHSPPTSEVEQFVRENSLRNLHPGEQECLLVCLSEGISILLTDDMVVRDAAKQLNVLPIGSLGIAVSAFKRGELTLQEAERCIADLYDTSSLFVTRAIAELAIEQLRAADREQERERP